MAAIKLALPGTEYGPCVGECQHRDCAATRKMAATPCGLCTEVIGFNRYFFNDDQHGLVHEDCLHAKVEAAQQEAIAEQEALAEIEHGSADGQINADPEAGDGAPDRALMYGFYDLARSGRHPLSALSYDDGLCSWSTIRLEHMTGRHAAYTTARPVTLDEAAKLLQGWRGLAKQRPRQHEVRETPKPAKG